MLEIGQEAPPFKLQDQHGNEVASSDLAGTPVLVYFYPKDDTAGCTTQACGIRDQWQEFQEAGAEVFGVSPDGVDSHARFAAKFDLPQRLLADPERTMIEAYGAWGTKKRYGKEYDGVIRSTVLIDGAGRVARVWPDVQPKTHADEVLTAIRALGASPA